MAIKEYQAAARSFALEKQQKYFPGEARRFLDAITFAGDGDELGVAREPVKVLIPPKVFAACAFLESPGALSRYSLFSKGNVKFRNFAGYPGTRLFDFTMRFNT